MGTNSAVATADMKLRACLSVFEHMFAVSCACVRGHVVMGVPTWLWVFPCRRRHRAVSESDADLRPRPVLYQSQQPDPETDTEIEA